MKHWTEYTGFEWLLVDVASRYGMDKEHNSVRIEWAKGLIPLVQAATDETMLTLLMKPYIDKADEVPMFCGALLALWDTINGRVSTWQVGQDAASSGPQLLSTLLKDVTGMRYCGVIGTVVPDLYTSVTNVMNTTGVTISRTIVKKGIIPHVYASEVEPKKVFKKNYHKFLESYKSVVGKAQEASDFMVNAWNSNAHEHRFVMPDGADIIIPVLVQHKKTIPCGKHTFEYIYDAIGSRKKGEQGTKGLSANTTHPYDAYVLRELNRRCNYDLAHIQRCIRLLKLSKNTLSEPKTDDHLLYLEHLFYEFNQPSAVAFEYLDEANVHWLSEDYTSVLLALAESMLVHASFEVSNIHDEFKCLPAYCSDLKTHYNQIMAETYLSNWWTKTAEHLSGIDVSFMANEVDMSIISEIMSAPYSVG